MIMEKVFYHPFGEIPMSERCGDKYDALIDQLQMTGLSKQEAVALVEDLLYSLLGEQWQATGGAR